VPLTVLTGSGEWITSAARLPDASWDGRQNGGGDLRIDFSVPGMAVAEVVVVTEAPDVREVQDVDARVADMTQRLGPFPGPGPGMSYLFDNLMENGIDELNVKLYRAVGLTSVQTYVTWETCERAGEGEWDWSEWDRVVDLLRANDLKWIPFLICGPAYSLPDWFRAHPDHIPCRSLERGEDSKIASLWNPNMPRWVDRFLAAFAARYGESGVLESVNLGIQGDYGEAIYAVHGGWTQIIPGPYPSHLGFWCDDPYALADYRAHLTARYRDISLLNRAWGTAYPAFADVDFPGRKDDLAEFRATLEADPGPQHRQWLDFVTWYRQAMTDFADWWLGRARFHFPESELYLCTGGHGAPEHGSVFSEQCRVAAKHAAGVRITNEGSYYHGNYFLTRLVATAGLHYGSPFGFEPAALVTPQGVVARIFNATTSGAVQMTDKNVNILKDAEILRSLARNQSCLFRVQAPVVPVAVWYPITDLTFRDDLSFRHPAQRFRTLTDAAYADSGLVLAGALDACRVLVVLYGQYFEPAETRKLVRWVENGGVLLVLGTDALRTVAGDDLPERELFGDTSNGRTLGSGRTCRVPDWEGLTDEFLRVQRELGLPICRGAQDEVFCSQIGPERFLFLNMAGDARDAVFEWGERRRTVELEPVSITDLDLTDLGE
jgi:hypothetical protein